MPTLNTEIERPPATLKKLQAENDELRLRLQEAEETIAAIRSGAVDALVVEEPAGHRIYTLEGADRPYRVFVEEMQQGAATLHVDGTIAWCNRQLADLLKTPQDKLVGAALHDFISPDSRAVYDNLLWQGKTHSGRGEANLRRAGGGLVSAYLTFNALPKDCGAAIGVLVTDQTPQRHHEQLTAAHASLRESERRFREMIDALPVAIYTTDAEGRLTHFNPAAVEFSGRTPELGTDQWCVSFKLFHPDGTPLPHDECPMAVALKEGRVIRGVEAIAERPDGTRRWFTPYPTPLRDSAGKIVGGINMLLDITERKQAEDELRANEERFRTLFELGPVAVYSCDAAGVIQMFNQRAAELWGRAPAAGDTDERFCGSFKLFRPDGTFMPHELCPMGEVLSGRIPVMRDGEVIIERPDGSRVTVIVNIRPLKEKSGEITGAINFFYDVTERKHAEQVRAKLAAIVESSDDAIISKDLNGVITSWNRGAEQLFGYTAQEAIGQPVILLIPSDHLDEEPAILERIRRGDSIDHYETVRRRKDGGLLDISLTISPIRNDQGQVVGASKIARDISHRIRNEEALRDAQMLLADRAVQLEQAVAERTAELSVTNKQLEAFAYSVAHDLRAPVRSMEGFSALLLEEAGASLSEAGQDFANRINRAAQFMDALLMDLLTFSSTAQQRIELAPVKLERVVESVLSRLEKEIQETNARVETSGPWPTVLAHEPTLGQVLFNLVSNALKFVDPGMPPQIRVWAEQRHEGIDGLVDEWMSGGGAPSSTNPSIHSSTHPPPAAALVRVWVEDKGIGIAPDHQEQIFRLFTRLHGEQYPGTGVGLAIVHRGTERMGGRVGVESTPGQGSRFWFELRKA